MLQGKKYIFFDMDGTLIDSMGVWNDVDYALICELGGTDAPGAAIGTRRDGLLREYRDEPNPYAAYCGWVGRHCGSPLSPEELLRRRDAIARRKLVEDIAYKPGVPELLRFLKGAGFGLGIATTTRRANMEIYRKENRNLLSAAPIDAYFSHVLTREDVAAIKPDPEVYDKIREAFGAAREECLIFEDSLTGMLAAKNAGIEAAAVYDEYAQADQKEILALGAYHFQDFHAVLAAARQELASAVRTREI